MDLANSVSAALFSSEPPTCNPHLHLRPAAAAANVIVSRVLRVIGFCVLAGDSGGHVRIPTRL